jgi:hypothetical protein
MQLRFQGLKPGEEPIKTVAEYTAARQLVDELEQQVQTSLREIKQQRERGSPPGAQRLAELDRLSTQADQTRYAFFRRQPYVLVARCPYCQTPVWMKVGLFSLRDNFWQHPSGNGRDGILDSARCAHLFCVDGALNLQGSSAVGDLAAIKPDEAVISIQLAAEVPFVKPRVLTLPTMLGVVHRFTVADQFTAYPLTYFAENLPDQMEFCLGWAKTEYWDRLRPSGHMLIGTRSDRQEYDLERWISQGKLRWLDPDDQAHPLAPPMAQNFPYRNVAGRRHPYRLDKGVVIDLPDPVESNPVIHIEDAF